MYVFLNASEKDPLVWSRLSVQEKKDNTWCTKNLVCQYLSHLLVHQTFPVITSVFTLESRSHHFSSILSYIIKSFPPLLFLELRETFLSGWSHLFSFILPMFSVRGYQKPILPFVLWTLSFPIFSCIFNLCHWLLNMPTFLSSYKETLTQTFSSAIPGPLSYPSQMNFLKNVSSPTDFIFSPASLSTHSNTTSIPTTQQNVTLQGHQYFHFDKFHGYLGVTFSTIYLFHSQISFSLFGFLCFPRDLSFSTFLNCPSLSWPLMYFLRQLIRLSFLLPQNSP